MCYMSHYKLNSDISQEKGKDKMQNDYVKEVKQEYFRNWRKNNKDKVKKNNANYWKKKADLLKKQKEGIKNDNK